MSILQPKKQKTLNHHCRGLRYPPPIALETKPNLRKKSYDDSDLERLKRHEILGKTLPMIEPLRFERAEVKLNAFLRIAPVYV